MEAHDPQETRASTCVVAAVDLPVQGTWCSRASCRSQVLRSWIDPAPCLCVRDLLCKSCSPPRRVQASKASRHYSAWEPYPRRRASQLPQLQGAGGAGAVLLRARASILDLAAFTVQGVRACRAGRTGSLEQTGTRPSTCWLRVGTQHIMSHLMTVLHPFR